MVPTNLCAIEVLKTLNWSAPNLCEGQTPPESGVNISFYGQVDISINEYFFLQSVVNISIYGQG